MSIITNLLTDLEQLDSYHSEQELEEQGHHHDVADSFDRDNQTLNNLLQAFRPVDGSEGSEHTENTENLQETDTAATEDGDEWDGDNHNIENVEWWSAEGSFVEEESVRDQLETALDREDRGENVIKILESLKKF